MTPDKHTVLIALGTALCVLPLWLRLLAWIDEEFGLWFAVVVLCWTVGISLLCIAWVNS